MLFTCLAPRRSIHSRPIQHRDPAKTTSPKENRVPDNEHDGAESYECDALVVGSGAAGMSAAITAAHGGLKVIIAEKEATFGGTTARSGGWLWIPGTSLARGWGIVESADQARTYLRHEAGNAFDAARVDAFLSAGPEAVDFFSSHTAAAIRHAAGVSGLPRRSARRRAGRPLDGDAAVRWPRARPAHQKPRRAAAGIDRVRHDARLGQGDHSLHARDQIADIGALCGEAAVAASARRDPSRPRHDAHQRQRARRAAGEIRRRPEYSAVAVIAGARTDRRGWRGARRDGPARGAARARPRQTRRDPGLRRLPA